MPTWNVIVAALDGYDTLAQQIVERTGRLGTPEIGIKAIDCPLQSLGERGVNGVDLVIIIGPANPPQSTTLPWLNLIEEAGVPMLALVDGPTDSGNLFQFVGGLVHDASISEDVLFALIQGMIHRQKDVQTLRKEVALNQRFHGGLKGEINKMHEELQLAALVQREFLPREAPSLHGVEFAALWRPTNYVSGDIYDLIRLDEDHVGVFIADAVGHGVPAALMTMVISRSLITKEIIGAAYRLLTPSEVLARLNHDMIRRQGRSTRFATAVYAVINCRERTMQLAGAGHPPPLLLRASGTSCSLETTGGLLGVFPDESYSHIQVELQINDRILFYTDGFEQAFPQPQSDPHQRRVPTNNYRTEFDQLAALPHPNDMIDTISRRLDDQSGSLHQVDDLTLVCMHAGPLAISTTSERSSEEPVGLRLAS